jgi:hypothetical protein
VLPLPPPLLLLTLLLLHRLLPLLQRLTLRMTWSLQHRLLPLLLATRLATLSLLLQPLKLQPQQALPQLLPQLLRSQHQPPQTLLR